MSTRRLWASIILLLLLIIAALILSLLMAKSANAQPAKIQALQGFADEWAVDTVIYNGDARRVTYSSGADTLFGYYSVNDSLTTYRAQVGDTLWIDTVIWGLRGYTREDLELARMIEQMPDRDDSGWPDLVERLRHLRLLKDHYEN